MKEVEEVQLPRGWQVASIGETCSTGSGGTPSRKNKSFYQGNIPWVKSGELNYQTIIDTEEKITQEAIEKSSAKVVEKGTLLIALYGTTVGKLAFLGVDAATNQAVCFIKVPKYLDNKFLYYCLFSKRSDLLQKRIGGAQPNISQGIINETEIPLPPLDEQHRIIAKIEELFSELDNGVAQLRQVQAQLKSYRQSVLKHAFEGKLTEIYRSRPSQELPPAQILLATIQQERADRHQEALSAWQQAVIQWAEAGKPGKKPPKPKAPKEIPPLTDEEVEKLPILPEVWMWVKLGNTIETIFDGPFGSNLKTNDYVEEGIRVIRLENIGYLEFNESKETFISEEKYRSLEKHTVHCGDIVFSSFIADNIRCVVLPSSIDKAVNKADCFCIRNNNSLINQLYLAYLLSARQSYKNLSLRVHGATRPRINTTQLKELPIPLCSTEEQHQIVQEIESRLSVAEHLEKTVADSLRQAEVLRQSILQRAFSGQLVSQDPNDEPAAELLKRIQAENSEGKSQKLSPLTKGSQKEQLSFTF